MTLYLRIAGRGLLILCAAGALAACGGGGGGGDSPPPPPSIPTLDLIVDADIEVGAGTISPYRLAALEGEPDTVLALTGRGETFSEGQLHALDDVTLQDVRTPIEVGANGADLVMLGTQPLVVSRGTARAYLIDLAAWGIDSEVDLGFVPAAAAVLSDTEVVVVGATEGRIAVLGLRAGALAVLRRGTLNSFAYEVTASPDGSRIYVVEPAPNAAGVEVLDAASLSRVDRIELPGEPSRGALVWEQYLVVSNRDGYLHFIDRATSQVETVDLAPLLGLARESLPVRGIDSGDVVDAGNGRLAVINGRQDSLLFVADPTRTPGARAVARLPSGSFALYRATERQLWVTLPSINAVVLVDLPEVIVDGSRVTGRRVTTGREATALATLGTVTPGIAALDSLGRVTVVNGQSLATETLVPPVGESWLAPLIEGPEGLTLVSRRAGRADQLLYMDRHGVQLGRQSIALSAVFSGAQRDGTVMLVSRLNRTISLVDLVAGTTATRALQRDRPRAAARLSGSTWLIVHDTTPDIGITLLRDGAEQGFETFDDWFVGILPLSNGSAFAACFNGAIVRIDADGRITRVRRESILANASDLRPGTAATAWVTSESAGRAHRVDVDQATVTGRLPWPGVTTVTAIPGTDKIAVLGARRLVIGHLAP